MIKKIKNRQIEFALLVIVMFQIFLLINMITANSYVIHQTDGLIENAKVINKKENKFKSLINSGINLLIGFLSIKQIGIVSAQEISCCLRTGEGKLICHKTISIDTSCEVDLIPTSCDEVPDCELGCCFDPIEGLCTPNSYDEECVEGDWDDDESCSIQKCKKGCCISGDEAFLATETRCGYLNGEFRQIWNELDCKALVASEFKGACVLEGGACKFTTEYNCVNNLDGTPHIGYLCSHPSLNTICQNQTSIGCVDGEDEIYWIDSCLNPENIYSSNRQQSWNNGMVLSKEESCGATSSNDNIDSTTCGNCARPLSICSETGAGETHVQDGDYICKDLGCKDAPANGPPGTTQDRIHSETWCLYESSIGEIQIHGNDNYFSSDAVGSEHWVASCLEGEVEIDPIDNPYRGEICQEQIIEEDGRTYSMASSVINDASICITYNPLQEEEDGKLVDNEKNIEDCENNKHCMIKNVNIAKYFKFNMCVPRYPKGADLLDGMDDNICSMATEMGECTVYYKKKLIGGWTCEENCDCQRDEFAEKMNDLCVSLGDCGSYINYVGEGTDNVGIRGKKGKRLDSDGKEKDKASKGKGHAPNIYSWTNYIRYATPVKGQHVEPQNIDEFLASLGGSGGDYDPTDYGKILTWLGGISGATGSVYLLNKWAISKVGVLINIGKVGANFLTVTGCAAIGAALGSFLAKALGISGWAAIAMIVLGGFAGAMVGLYAVGVIAASNPAGWIAAAIAAVIIAILAIFGIGKTETRRVEFTCLPWNAPTFTSYGEAQENCEKCNEDPLIPCTEYKCNSLGLTCRLLNKNEENPICESLKYEPNPPVITPGEVYTEGYDFTDVEDNKVKIISGIREDGCVQEWASVYFRLDTDESAQCKWSLEKPEVPDYNEMEGEYALEQNLFVINHTFEISIESLDSLYVYNVTGDLKEQYGNMNMYIKCRDYWYNYNIDEYIVKFCVNSGPDITSVWHKLTVTDPANGSSLKYGTNETDLTMWINEPAECRYDIVAGKNYEDMENNMTCDSSLTRPHIYGWPCKTKLTNLVSGKNEFYIKCKDKPWVDDLTEEEIETYKEEYGEEYLERNVNEDDYPYTLFVTESELTIDSVTFSSFISDRTVTITSGETFISGFEPISVDVEVITSGGADNGNSECKWGVLEEGSRWPMSPYYTLASTHTQTLTDRMNGTHIIYIDCIDEAGNEANAVGEFIIEVDSDAPKVVRVYQEGSKLKLITNEDAKCYYDFNRCSFSINNETLEFDSTGYSTEHTAEWITGQTYYVKCKDLFGIVNDKCAIKIKLSS